MLELYIPEKELFDEEADRFISVKEQHLKLEHSLVSISKWESRWLKPFFDKKEKKTREELLDYIRCMIVNPAKNYDVVAALSSDDVRRIVDYINNPQTATTVTFLIKEKKPRKQENVTAELIYYWMIKAGIPFECDKWHISKLFALIKVCGAKNDTGKKGTSTEYAQAQSALNAQRRAKLKSKG